jgi:hypothetical protein
VDELTPVLALGLVITMVLKHVNSSTNPFWCVAAEGRWSVLGMVISAAAVAELATRPGGGFPIAPVTREFIRATAAQQVAIGMGFGSLVHLIHTFATDGGTIISWTWTGFPVTGPTHPAACLVIAVACAACVAPAWWPIGVIGAVVLYRYPDWIGFVGGLALVWYLVAALPGYLRAVSLCPGAIGWGLLLYCVLGVVSVVTTAYAFVPFGNLVRERTDLVLGFSMAWVVAGNLAAGMVRMPQGLLERSNRRIRRVKMWTGVTAVLLGLAAFATSYSELSTEAPKPYAETGRVFSGGIWTVSRQRRIANVRCILAWTWQAGTVRDA